MHAIGDGVTRNFLDILQHDIHRAAKGFLLATAVAALVLLLAYVSLRAFPAYGFLFVPGVFAAAFLVGAAYTRWFVLGSYEVSLRDHWNRWMRWSVSCRTVRECYAKVHDRRPEPGWWLGGSLVAALILAHLVLAGFMLNGTLTLGRALPFFVLDAALLGFIAARRYWERRWYRRFLRSCNELLRDGSLGLWGVY